MQASGAKSASLRYDPLGRLYATGNGASENTWFVYDGDELVAEYNGSGALLRRYIHGAGVDDPIVWIEGASATAADKSWKRGRTQLARRGNREGKPGQAQ